MGYAKGWKPAEVNILLTAVEQKGISKGSALAAKRLGRSAAGCLQKYYLAIKKLPLKELKSERVAEVKKAPIPPTLPTTPVKGAEIISGKLVAQGDNLLVIKAEGRFIMINT